MTSPSTSLEPSPDPMAAESDLAEGISSTSRSPAQLALRRFLRHRAAVTGSIVLIIITLAVVLAPWIAPYGETELVGDPRHGDRSASCPRSPTTGSGPTPSVVTCTR